MKTLTAAGAALVVGVTATWLVRDKLSVLVRGDTCCPRNRAHDSADLYGTRNDTTSRELTPPSSAAVDRVEPWEPIDEAFRGCDHSCGARATSAEDGVVVQTTRSTAKSGDKVYCPVSGVVFEVTEQSAHRDVDGKRFYFCCESCAAYFSANQAHVLSGRRGA